MNEPPIPDTEMRAYGSAQESRNLARRISTLARENDTARQFGGWQFISDFEQIAHAIAHPDRDRVPRPHGLASLPPFRTERRPQRLPLGPLRRMIRLIGPHALHYLIAVSADQGANFYRLELRPRLDKEFRDGNRYKRYDKEQTLISFGNAVLERERNDDMKRSEALVAAAIELGIAASARSHERYFQQFRLLCARRGFVPSPYDWMEGPPRFALADLDGRSSDKSEK